MSDVDPNEPFSIYEDIGMVIRNPTGIVRITIDLKLCILCGISEFDHNNGLSGKYESLLDHPFFRDNLAYLVWKHERNNDPK